MITATCTHERLSKHGRDRKGNQRWKCCRCGVTVTREHTRPLGDMRIDPEQALMVLKMLLEGMSIRACERITGVKCDTISALVLHVGRNCDRFLTDNVRNVAAKFIELDEIWGFVGCKAKTAELRNRGEEFGDSWCWLAIDADTKLVLSHTVGKRDTTTSDKFLARLNGATVGPCQVTADGYANYTYGVPFHMGSRCNFAQLVKSYKSSQAETRYSPAQITGIEKIVRFGNVDMERVSTSYSERLNLSLRMHVRRLTRLTNAFSKTAEYHAAMIALFVAYYNYCRKHETLKGRTPAMASGLAAHGWSLKELLAAAA